MPMENHKDTFFIPSGPTPVEKTEELKKKIARCDAAIRSINNEFAILKNMQMLGPMSLDKLVETCLKRLAVQEYIARDSKHESYARKREMLAHISMKIKEYIDAKN